MDPEQKILVGLALIIIYLILNKCDCEKGSTEGFYGDAVKEDVATYHAQRIRYGDKVPDDVATYHAQRIRHGLTNDDAQLNQRIRYEDSNALPYPSQRIRLGLTNDDAQLNQRIRYEDSNALPYPAQRIRFEGDTEKAGSIAGLQRIRTEQDLPNSLPGLHINMNNNYSARLGHHIRKDHKGDMIHNMMRGQK